MITFVNQDISNPANISFNSTLFEGLHNLQILLILPFYNVSTIFTDNVFEHVQHVKFLLLHFPSPNVISFNNNVTLPTLTALGVTLNIWKNVSVIGE